MTDYYNEIDPYCVQWLRNLIDAKLIAPGVVDDRSITDIEPSDLLGFRQCHFFAGIAVWSYALRQAGWPDDRQVWTGSCPCQPFSTAGKMQGFDDDRHLWPVWKKLIAKRRPANIFGEQVARGGGLEWFDVVQTDLEAEDYAVGAASLCAAGYGANHIRDRLYFFAHADTDRVGLETIPHAELLRLETSDRGCVGRPGEMGNAAVWSEPYPTGARPVALGDRPADGLGQLRAYGNALAAPVAVAFIKAAMQYKP